MLSVLGSFSIFSAENFHSSSDSEGYKVYDHESIHILKDHYQDDENTARYQWDDFRFEMILIRSKWFGFKSNIESNKFKMKQTTTEWSLQYIAHTYQGQEFSLIIKYAKVAIKVFQLPMHIKKRVYHLLFIIFHLYLCFFLFPSFDLYLLDYLG